jgi:hypothetical protein
VSGVLTAGQYATATLAIVGLISVLFRFFVLLPLKAYIKEATYPISPNANGGKSLADVADTVRRIDHRLDSVERRLIRLEDTPEKRMS